MKVFIAGWPHVVGGAGGEALHAALLWRRYGLDVGWIPTWNQPDKAMTELLTSAGMTIHQASPRTLDKIPGLRGASVCVFCNEPGAKAAKYFQALGCRMIGVPCMAYLLAAFRTVNWSTIVCQSEFQREILKRPEAVVIRGAYEWQSVLFEPRPHAPGEPFVLARIARGHVPKWSSRLYEIMERVPNRKAILLGVSEGVARRLGRPPEWAATYGPGDIPAADVYRQAHCYLSANGEDKENWPRVGLEAMAYGVPIVAENKWGWREMLVHDLSGLLYDTPEQASEYATMLANDEAARMEIARNARDRLERYIANPQKIFEGWVKVFGLTGTEWDPSVIAGAEELIRINEEPTLSAGSEVKQPDARSEARLPAETKAPGFLDVKVATPETSPLPAGFLGGNKCE
jgi:hypothetical protein